jgi:outer membrane protein assembly factor BamA
VVAPRGKAAVHRVHADLRGFVGLVRQSVLSLRLQYAQSDGPLPLYERYLVGGAGTLRGYRPGSFSGDNMAAATAEVRIPLSSPLSVGKIGMTLFADTGTAYNHGERIGDARFRYGAGGGVFLLVSVLQLNADVGFREGLGARVHLSTGLQF